ncbi:hypothetical protein [Pseudonocardia sp. GCM10023141]|uniref:hypothetical protein n=1 Tax=Pseudonocardia sp. GCM10023141 TaxID=3252653 RepID=UPI0036208E57
MRRPEVPLLEAILGGLWWIVGALALDSGSGTVVLAAGLAATGWFVLTLRRRHGSGTPLPPGGRARLVRTIVVTLVVIVGAGVGLGYLTWGELTVPVACVAVGLALFAVSAQLDERVLLAAGGALLVLGATGALFALDASGSGLYQGFVGLAAAVVVWAAGAVRAGLVAEARQRVGRR